MFRDRVEAGRLLGEALAKIGLKETVVVALPCGGVPAAAEVAAILGVPLDLILVRKITAPGHSELAVAAIGGPEGEEMVVNAFVAVGAWHGSFPQVTDNEVIALLGAAVT
jgi:putative phosphoribosyl transferase